MDISKTIAELKKDPGFAQNVGMILVHNGIVRGWSRKGHENVTSVDISVDRGKIDALVDEYKKKDGIYTILVEALDGMRQVGDDVLFILVAGDIREHIKPVLAELLDRIKAEAITKREIIST